MKKKNLQKDNHNVARDSKYSVVYVEEIEIDLANLIQNTDKSLKYTTISSTTVNLTASLIPKVFSL